MAQKIECSNNTKWGSNYESLAMATKSRAFPTNCIYFNAFITCYIISLLRPLETCEFRPWKSLPSITRSHPIRIGSARGSISGLLRLKGGADEDSEQNLIGDLVLDDIEGRTLEQEIEALERELEEAHDSRAVAEQVTNLYPGISIKNLVRWALLTFSNRLTHS
jgi:hypothetical protein